METPKASKPRAKKVAQITPIRKEEVIVSENVNQKVVELQNNAKFTLQKPGAMWYLQHADNCKNGAGVLQQSKYVIGLLRNCVVEQPKIEDFDDDVSILEELVGEIESFLRNKRM